MTRRFGTIFVVLAIVVSACAQAETSGLESGSSATVATTTSTPIPTTTEPATSVTEPSPTTTRPAVTTTTLLDVATPEAIAVQSAFARSAEVVSGRMEGSMSITGIEPVGDPASMVIPFGGTFDNASGDFSFFMDMSAASDVAGMSGGVEFADLFGEMEVRQVGTTAYVRFPFFNMFLDSQTSWISMPADGSDPTAGFTMAAPGNPSEILSAFRDAGTTVEVVGTEDVNGVVATRYAIVIDTAAMLDQANAEERAELDAVGPIPIDSLPMDVWITEDGFVVRFVMEIDGDSVKSAPDEAFGQMTMRYDLFDLNGEVTIEPPATDDVTPVDDLASAFNFDF